MATDIRQLRDRRDYARTFDGEGNLDIQGERNIWHEDLDLSSWDDEDDAFVELWNEGKSLFDIADFFNRPQIEVLIWGTWLDYNGKIKRRPGYLWGVNS